MLGLTLLTITSLDNAIHVKFDEEAENSAGTSDQEAYQLQKLNVTKLEILVTELCENNRVAFQEELLATRSTKLLFKHVKRLFKSATIPKLMSYAGRCSSNDFEKANMLNQYFHSVFSTRKRCQSATFHYLKFFHL